MSAEEKHLTDEQIDCLIGIQPGVSLVGVPSEAVEEARRHVATCEGCHKLVSMYKELRGALGRLEQETPAVANSECPPEKSLRELAAGFLSSEEAKRLLKHAVQCDHCGPLFKEASETFSLVATTEETSILTSLQTAQPDWQRRFARELSKASRAGIIKKHEENESPLKILRWRWAFAAAAALVVLAGFLAWKSWQSSSMYAGQLLAKAYGERRTLEIRIPGAPAGVLRVNRGALDSNFDRPSALLEAENIIKKGLIKDPQNVLWLQQRLRADLLDGNSDAAVQEADLLKKNPGTPSLLVDIGSAYFLRGERNASASDYLRSYEYFSQALSESPNDPVARFNRAVVAERAQLYTQAQEDWKFFLRVDSDDGWRREARSRLEEIERKLKERKDESRSPLADPEELAAAHSERRQEELARIDSSAESYILIATETWIPELTKGHILDAKRRESLQRALQDLAGDLSTRHSDRWLADFLSDWQSGSQSGGALLLSKSIQESANGRQEAAIQFARSALSEFSNERNQPGKLSAIFERVYATRLAAHGAECYDEALELVEEVKGRNYAWLETQAELEAAACAAATSRIDEAVARSERALKLARASRYGDLELRAIVFLADGLTDPNMQLDVLRNGLVDFWQRRHEPMRGYSLYAEMDYVSGEELQLWFANEAIIKEGLRLLSEDPDLSLRGLETYRLARAQLATNEFGEAQRSISEAGMMLSKSSSPALSVAAVVDLADAYVMKRRYQDALGLLGTNERDLEHYSQDVLVARFESVKAAALIGEGQNQEAEATLLSALNVLRKGLVSLKSEPDRRAWLRSMEPVSKSVVYLESQQNPESAFRWWESFKEGYLAEVPTSDTDPAIADWHWQIPAFASWHSQGTILLSFVLFPEGIEVWSYDGIGVKGKWIPRSSIDVTQEVRAFRKDCQDPTSDSEHLLVAGRDLYNLLISPVADETKGKSRLIIEADTSLESLPFEALVDEHGRYLGDEYEIEYCLSLRHLVDPGKNGQLSRKSTALVIAQSLADVRDGLPYLPGVATEARMVATEFDDSKLLIDEDAQFPLIVKALPFAEVFHFAGHAISNRSRTQLVLADSPSKASRFLGETDLDSHLLRKARLVVLSACATADSGGTGPDNHESLAGSLLNAGVPNVVASRWAADSAATVEWMRSFYATALREGNVASAAKKARAAVRASKSWRHPFYWASFGVFV